jgi:hypothetical protein
MAAELIRVRECATSVTTPGFSLEPATVNLRSE